MGFAGKSPFLYENGDLMEIARQVVYGSVRPCDECDKMVPFDNPDADYRICNECLERIVLEP